MEVVTTVNTEKLILWFAVLPLATLVLSGCVSVQYVGEEYPRTSHVDVYYKKSQIPWKYHVMGKAVATTPEGMTGGDLQENLKHKAELEGADAVLVLSIRKLRTGEQVNDWAESECFGPYWGWGGDYGDDYWDEDMLGPPFDQEVSIDPMTDVTYTYRTEVKALFLRYITKNGKRLKLVHGKK